MKKLIYSIFIYSIFYSCAQKVPPVGGKKDIISPKLIATIPKNQSTNFNGKTIELYFDEYVKVENINQNLLITPAIEASYTTKIKTNGVKLTLAKPLKPNTTYNFNFRNTFKDITENNIAKNIRLVLSTGDKIDSLKVKGKVIDPLINKPVLDALVGLYKLTDSLNIKKEKPYYFTKTDSTGSFNIENIQSGKYKVFAFTDNNNNTIFNEQTEKIGYLLDTLNIDKNIVDIQLNLVKQDKLPLKILKIRSSVTYANIELNKGIVKAKLKYVSKDSLPYMLTNEREIKIFNTKNTLDSIKFEFTAIDSIGKEYVINQKFLFKKATKKIDTIKEEFKYTLEPSQTATIENNTPYIFTFTKPVANFDYSKIKVLNDTLNHIAVSDSNFKWSDQRDILTISIKTKSKNSIRISVSENAIFSIENDTLKAFKQDNRIVQADDTGIISGIISNSKGNEIVQLLSDKYHLVKEIKYQKKYFFKNVAPGKYYIRLICDDNKNGVWDTGDYEKNINPEKIQFINKLIQIKANFELSGFDFSN
jgi:uncharacterized protein (DUF2141 family)